jgi:uncharacterized protein (DUF305 family)
VKGFSKTLMYPALALVITAAGCAGVTSTSGTSGTPEAQTAVQPSANPVDVHFMTGMIHHHAQALVMARWALTQAANPTLPVLAERIIVSQNDEIGLIQLWLLDNGVPVPEPNPAGMRMMSGGVEHDMLMPGMLTPQQWAELGNARGAEFDRLFLQYMILHHQGAVAMVQELFDAGGGVDNSVYKFASDTYADQGSEIDRMQKMLEAMRASQ